MVEIEFSVMEGDEGEAQHLLPLLEAFQEQYHIHVNLTGITWSKGWGEIAKFGIYGHGPDVSCIGTSWIGSLAAMQALRSYTAQEVRTLGGADAFFESIWHTGFLPSDETLWAVPWLGDPMVLYFWKNRLKKAGINNYEAAFSTDAALLATLKQLQESGVDHPMALTTTAKSIIVHEAASWIWNAGGDFISPDRRQITFNQPAALAGWKNYFSLRPFVSPESLKTEFSGNSFNDKEACVFPGGPWYGVAGRQSHPDWSERLGIIQVPGTPYVGGASFVIWRYTKHPAEAFELVHFLSSQPTRIAASPYVFELPTRRESLNISSVETDVFHRTYLQTLQNGRSFPTMRLWGSIEDKLIAETARMWTELFEKPNLDVDAWLHQHLDPLAKRLNILLSN